MGNQCCAKERGGDNIDLNPESKPRTLADSTQSDHSVETMKAGDPDSYGTNHSVLSTGVFTNDPNYSSTEVNIDDFKI